MKKEVNNPHDKFFKSFIYERQNAIDFFKTFLPEDLSEIIDIDSLTIENSSFINNSLGEIFSDAIFRCKIKDNTEEVYISILIEHKSFPDKYVAVQLVNYLGNAYLMQLKEKNDLELVVPFIYYHGKENWLYKPLPLLIKNIPNTLKKFVPDFDSIFVDLNKMSESELRNIDNLMLLSALFMQKFSFDQQSLLNRILEIITHVSNYEQNRGNFLQKVFVYFNELVEIDLDDLKKLIESLPKDTKYNIMTTYQLIKQEGKKEGIQEGIEKKTIDVILRGWENGISVDTLASITGLSEKKVKHIIDNRNN